MMPLAQLNACLGWFLVSLASTPSQLYSFVGVMLLNGCFFPVVRTAVCDTFGKQRLGQSLAALATVEQLCELCGIPLFTSVYKATTSSVLGPVHCITFLSISGSYLLA